jgi:chemotaxis protein CheD
MRYTIGLAEMALSNKVEDSLVTHALGSCVGIVVYDGVAKVGGILHAMLPLSTIDLARAQERPLMYVDTGVPALFRSAYDMGATKENLKVYLAGGASVISLGVSDMGIGERNVMVAHKLFWKNKIMVTSESVGGTIPRTLYLNMDTGRCWFTSSQQEYLLSKGE